MKNKIYLLILILFIIASVFFVYKRSIKNNAKAFAFIEQDLFLRVDKIRDIKVKKRHIETPEPVRAAYMSSWIASSPRLRKNLVEFIDSSELNSVVIDIKDYSGLISFNIDHHLIDSYGTDSNRISDIDEFIKDLHDRDIYIIGRLTVFQDPLLAKVRPEFAFRRKDNGDIWRDKKGLAFINPQKEEAWEYYAVIAEESYARGFDEINFDYIRYPSDGNISNINYALGEKTRMKAMKNFYIFLDDRLRGQKIPISADLFGHTASIDNGLTIGQNMYDVLPYFDAVAPMVYPSHYSKTYLGFANAAAHPYEVVYHEMDLAMKKAESLGLPSSSLRTWIQDFDLGATYGIKEVRDQIKASRDAGVDSYMSWDPSNKYTKQAYYDNL